METALPLWQPVPLIDCPHGEKASHCQLETLLHQYMSTVSLLPTRQCCEDPDSCSWPPCRYRQSGFRSVAVSCLTEEAHLPQWLLTWQLLKPWAAWWISVKFAPVYQYLSCIGGNQSWMQYSRCGLDSADQKGMQPSMLLTFFLTDWLLFILLSPTSFSAELLPGNLPPAFPVARGSSFLSAAVCICLCWLSKCFLLVLLSSLFRSLWMATQPLSILIHFPVRYHLKTWRGQISSSSPSHWYILNGMYPRQTTVVLHLSVLYQVESSPLTATLWAQPSNRSFII